MATKGPVLWPVLLMAGISGAVVAAVAIYASYSHMHDLVLLAGEDEDLARIVPASIDGLVFFAAAVMWAQHKTGEKVHRMAPAALWLSGGASLGANVISKWPDVATSWLARLAVAAWPAVAVIVMGHLAVTLIGLVLRERRPATTRATPARRAEDRAARPRKPAADSRPEPVPDRPSGQPGRAKDSAPSTGRSLSRDELVALGHREADRLAREGRELSGPVLREVVRRDGGQAGNGLLAEAVRTVKAERAAAGNGTGQP